MINSVGTLTSPPRLSGLLHVPPLNLRINIHMNKLMISTGCSFSNGIVDKNTIDIQGSYGKLLSERLKYDFINLSQGGASNYHIAKQIEYAIGLNPSLVTVGATTHKRIDTYLKSDDKLEHRPTLRDFNYGSEAMPPHTLNSGMLVSRSYYFFNDQMESTKVTDEKEFNYNKEIYDFLAMTTRKELDLDRDKFILLGACSLLEKHHIPYIIVDFGGVFREDDFRPSSPILSHNWKQLEQQFPGQDGIHVNQLGQQFLCDELEKVFALSGYGT